MDWYANPITVSYNGNGSGVTDVPSAQTKTYDQNLTLSSLCPKRFGYSFAGWGTSSSSTSASYHEGNTYSTNASITLYAIWTQRSVSTSTYTSSTVYLDYSGEIEYIKFTPNVSGTYAFCSTLSSGDSYGYLYNSSGTQLASDDDSGDSRNFKITYDCTSGTVYYIGVKYYGSSTGTIPVEIKRQYTISYNANGGSGAPSSQTKLYGETLTLSSTTPTYSGRTFLGWSTSSTATAASYSAGSDFSSNGNYTLYAVWSSPTKYTLYYNANGGSGAPSSQIFTSGYSVTISSVRPTRFGYDFLGWSTSSSASSSSYTPGSSCTLSGNTTLYAVWKQNTLSSPSSDATAQINYGGEIKYYKFTPVSGAKYVIESNHSQENSTCYGKLYDASGNVILSGSQSIVINTQTTNFVIEKTFSDNNVYYIGVYWSDSSKTGSIPIKLRRCYTISYNANGGSGAPSSQTKRYGETLTLSSAIPTYSGRTFLGWSTSSTATSASYSAGASFSLNSNYTLYAVWSSPTTYSISYNANGGSNAPANQTKIYDQTLVLTTSKPTRWCYNLLGWATSSTATSASYYPGGNYTSNMAATLYAVWKTPTALSTSTSTTDTA
ncbi:MAG: InlB B-repeat-containing protein, partial [Firmicutes bacterium]|nr:InlB B-repeat-containing protein [Bacillota bacterium]